MSLQKDIRCRELEEALKDANERIASLERQLDAAYRHEEKEKLRFRNLFEMTPLGYQSLDESGNILEVNDAWLKKLGYSRDEVLGRNFSEFLVPEWQEHFAENFPRFKAIGEVLGVEFEMVRKDGATLLVSFTGKISRRIDGEFKQTHCVFQDITEARKAHTALKASESKWERVLQNTPLLGVSLDSRGEIRFVNAWFLESTGWSEQELLGRNWFDTFIPEDIREEILGVFEDSMHDRHGEGASSYENAILRKDGTCLNVEWFNVLSRNDDGTVLDLTCLGVDLTERNAVHQKILDSENKYRLLAEYLPALVAEVRADQRISYANKACTDFFGVSLEQASGRRVEEVVDAENAAAINRALSEVSKEKPDNSLTFEFERDGHSQWLECVFRGVFNTAGKIESYLAVGLDITERVDSQERLRAAKEAAQAANQAKSEFLANMSHEIRTPLNGIMGMLQLMESTELNTEQREYTHAAVKSSDRLTHLLSDILDLSRVEAGKMSLEVEAIDLKGVVSDVCELFELSAEQTGIDLFCDIDPQIPSSLWGDRVRVQQVLNNLVGNALKYTHSGQVKVGAYSQNTNSMQFRVLFVVSDTGIGIPTDRIDELFQPFTQASGGYTRRYEGAGLGLAICRHLVSLMGGSLTVESGEGEGTTMMFSLPFDTSYEVADETTIEDEGADEVVVAGLKALVVEDDYVNSYTLRILLEKAGIRAETASTGQEAIDALKEDSFDVVVMDIQMPEMNGIEATEAIRRGDAGAQHTQIPIVAMTAYAMDGDRETFLNAGMNGYTSKPVERKKLLNAIAEAMVAPFGE